MVSRRLALVAGAALLVLATCSNPIDFNAAVEDAVKAGKDMYLKVVAVTPAQGDNEADPSSPVVFQFDRALNPDTIDAAVAAIGLSENGVTVATPWSSSFYNEDTHELNLYHDCLTSSKTYTATLETSAGLVGNDGSALRDTYSWSFYTKELPGGTARINSATSSATYATSTSITVYLAYNGLAQKARVKTSPFTDINDSWETAPPMPTSVPRTLVAGDGTKTVYYQFAGASSYSAILHVDVILDTTPPAAPTITTSATSVPTWVSGGGGNGTYRFRVDSESYHTVATTSYAYLLATGAHTLYVSERDAAGNYSTEASQAFTADISPLSGTRYISTFTSLDLYWSTPLTSVTLYCYPYRGETTTVLEATSPCAFPLSLSSLTTYYWYYTYTLFSRTYKKGPYSFTTAFGKMF